MKHILIKFKFENYMEKKQIQNQILCPLLLNEYTRGILVFLFIVNEPIDKLQDVEMFCKSDCFSKSKYERLQLETHYLSLWVMTQVASAIKVSQ